MLSLFSLMPKFVHFLHFVCIICYHSQHLSPPPKTLIDLLIYILLTYKLTEKRRVNSVVQLSSFSIHYFHIYCMHTT